MTVKLTVISTAVLKLASTHTLTDLSLSDALYEGELKRTSTAVERDTHIHDTYIHDEGIWDGSRLF